MIISISELMATIISNLLPNYSKFSTSSQFPSLPHTTLHHRNLAIFCCLSLKQPHDQTDGADQNDNLRVVFAAGSTGGHIYPAVAIAEELKIMNPTCEIFFFGATNSVESSVVSSAGYNFTSVPSVTLAQPLISLQNLLLPCYLVKSLVQCSLKLRDFKPHVVVGTGGLVSLPVCVAAKLLGMKLVIQEQNLVPVAENSILALLADVIFVAFNSTIDSFPRNKCVVCGNPVRLSLRKQVSKVAAMSHFFTGHENTGDSNKAKVLLVLGGSFGANAINIAMLNLYYQMLRRNDSLYIIWQTGIETYDEMESLVKIHPRLYLRP